MLTVNKSYIFNGTSEALQHRLNTWCKPNGAFSGTAEHVKDNIYAFYPTVSVGTITGTTNLPIKVFLRHAAINEEEQLVRLYTKFRPENYLIIVVTVLFVGASFSGELENTIEVLSTMGLVFLVANAVYRVQENMVAGQIRSLLKLREITSLDDIPKFYKKVTAEDLRKDVK